VARGRGRGWCRRSGSGTTISISATPACGWAPAAGVEHADRDPFTALQRPARSGANLRAHPGGSGTSIEGFADVRTIDVYGNPQPVGCWRNPDYRELWVAVAEDLFRSYDLDGFQWGAERA
jgi:hypothetical protein